MTNPVVIATSTVNGNIGSCSVVTTSLSVDSFHDRDIATNSCTGQIVGDYTYYDWGYVYIPAVIILIIFAFIISIKIVMD